MLSQHRLNRPYEITGSYFGQLLATDRPLIRSAITRLDRLWPIFTHVYFIFLALGLFPSPVSLCLLFVILTMIIIANSCFPRSLIKAQLPASCRPLYPHPSGMANRSSPNPPLSHPILISLTIDGHTYLTPISCRTHTNTDTHITGR